MRRAWSSWRESRGGHQGLPLVMKRIGMLWWLLAILGVLSGSSAGTWSQHPRALGMPRCPPGEEPTGGTCRPCPPGTFSPGDASCSPHTRCRAGNRLLGTPGTAVTDSSCGPCLPGFYSPEGDGEPRGRCLPCTSAPRSTPGCPGRRRIRSPEMLDQPTGTNGTRVTLLGEEEEEEAAAQAAVLTIVPVFCTMGLLGILVCNLLKKKGYYCTTSKDPQPPSTGPSSIYQLEDANEDTIGVLVRLITEKKENAAALEELLKEHYGHQPMSPPGYTPLNKLHLLPQFPSSCRHQQHLHTVQGPAPCARCSQKKWPEVLPPFGATKVLKAGSRPGEVTILSVGRFRVSRIPEMRSEVGGEPPRGALPVGNGMQPPWLKSTDGPPELAPGLGAASGGR
ncbi:tumor necrosis factor receptor superfamily member 19L isoform X2 [Apus apus]|uniref:tumor necrosis factor receptor superfamily member 19L isoform X2 n=1 Tax=Apus apus TaxID=8895 RepID=UPI0021F857F5|nr:tumor necrosis factor receptor superfamily member 19L isoform X2 [Apus apus]